MQQVHAGSHQTQPTDCIRQLLKIRHHAKVVWRCKVSPNSGNTVEGLASPGWTDSESLSGRFGVAELV